MQVDHVLEDEGETWEVTEGNVKKGLKKKLSLHNDPVIERAHNSCLPTSRLEREEIIIETGAKNQA